MLYGGKMIESIDLRENLLLFSLRSKHTLLPNWEGEEKSADLHFSHLLILHRKKSGAEKLKITVPRMVSAYGVPNCSNVTCRDVCVQYSLRA